MGKEAIICTIIIIAIIIGNILTQNYTVDTVESISQKLEELKSEALKEEEGRENTTKKVEEIKKEWEERHEKLAYYIEHNELEKIDTNLVGIESLLTTKEYAQAIEEIDKCSFILKHIEEKYAFNLENIF